MSGTSSKIFSRFGSKRDTSKNRGTKRSTSINTSVPKVLNQITCPDLSQTSGICLVICDPQVDLHKGGKIPVPYANKISQRIAQMISTYSDSIDEIYVSLQQRPSYHIGHPSFWQDNTGKAPDVFVHIDTSDIDKKKYLAKHREHSNWPIKYFELLQRSRFPTSNLVIFPEHCVVGSPGSSIIESIGSALRTWEKNRLRSVKYISKAHWSKVEQYSIFQPVVQVKEDTSTGFNHQLLSQMCNNKRVIICGHTLSHSVKYSILDFLKYKPNKNDTSLIIIQDLCSTLRDFRNGALHFLETLKQDNRVILSSSNKLSSIFNTKVIESQFLQSEISLFSKEHLRQFQSSRSNIGQGNVKNDQFFNFDQNGTKLLGDGCYMIYEQKNFGSLKAVWHRAKESVTPVDLNELRSCLGFFKPGYGAKIPDFKFENASDAVLDLARDIHKEEEMSTKRLFRGILTFVQECVKYDGTFILRASDESEDIFLDAGLYGLDANNNVIYVDTEHFVDPSSFSIISCIPKSANAYKGISKQTVSQFISTGEELGATLQLSL